MGSEYIYVIFMSDKRNCIIAFFMGDEYICVIFMSDKRN